MVYEDAEGYTQEERVGSAVNFIAVYSLCAGVRDRKEVFAQKATLGSVMIVAVQETHLDAVHSSRIRDL